MQQVVLKKNKLKLMDVPEPLVRPGYVLIANRTSLISAGTEKMVMDLAKKSLLGKAQERPDHVRRVLDKMRNEGFFSTISQVLSKLEEPIPLGYASSGVVLCAGAGVQEFKTGDLVASNGAHAGVVCVPRNLCAKVPAGVSTEAAAFTVLGAIALQGVRLAKLHLGETALVIGLGLVGQMTVALLKAQGCRVLGTDPDSAKCALAVKMGAETASPSLNGSAIFSVTNALGADAVLVTASTKSDGPIETAAEAVRAKGRIVIVGAVGMHAPRRPLYFKEAELVVSCSYGPGRYDPEYEDRGRDYPAAHVRWTEQRNMQAVLNLMANGQLDISPLISHRFSIEQGEKAYQLIDSGKEPFLGIVLSYPQHTTPINRIVLKAAPLKSDTGLGVGCLGAGNFARLVLIPLIQKNRGLRARSLCSAGGLTAAHAGEKFGFEIVSSDEDDVYRDPDVGVIFVMTRHNQHAEHVCKSIRSKKHVFVEKPLATSLEQLQEIESTILEAGESRPLVMVGFNRRFSPAAQMVRQHFQSIRQPISISIRFNAGEIPAGHWTQDIEIGGGRIIGEACHAIDLAVYLTGSAPVRVYAASVGGVDAPSATDDQCFITIHHANGSLSNVAYMAGGDKSFPKERIEVFGGGRVGVIDDFRTVTLYGNGKSTHRSGLSQDKGHRAEIEAFVNAVLTGGENPIPWADLRAVTITSILAVQSLREGVPFEVPQVEA